MSRPTPPTIIAATHADTRAADVRREWAAPRPRQPIPAWEPPKAQPKRTPRIVVKQASGPPTADELDRAMTLIYGPNWETMPL